MVRHEYIMCDLIFLQRSHSPMNKHKQSLSKLALIWGEWHSETTFLTRDNGNNNSSSAELNIQAVIMHTLLFLSHLIHKYNIF